MRISHISLTNFRNYARLELAILPGMIVLHGDNAQGKTSLLEAIYYLATSRSPHITADRQLISWLADDEPIPYARLVAEVTAASGLKRIEMTLLAGNRGSAARFKKEVRINGLPRRVMDLLGQILVVMFLPQDLALVEGAPVLRRRYMNVTLCQTDQQYCQALRKYEHTLSQRNALLRNLQEQGRRGDHSQLQFWDETLAATGAMLIAGRHRLLRDLERRAQRIHRDLSGAGEHLRLRYQPGFDVSVEPGGQMAFNAGDLGASALPELPPDEITGRFMEALSACRRDDLIRGITTIGPQRDEMRFLVNGHDLGLYGSRGQNRTAVLALKLAELSWMQEITGEWPILLLDEVAAELDEKRRTYLLERVGEAEQVLLTTTEPSLLPSELLKTAARWHVRNGTITVEETLSG
ncbi:MAG: DNA replication/repair protein RecF [Anaerolineae bacterium]|nr:DNA replication/repair protein RecF [Anaerolineae bacterium]